MLLFDDVSHDFPIASKLFMDDQEPGLNPRINTGGSEADLGPKFVMKSPDS